MSKRLYREFYLLPRGEQRGLILLSLLLILSLLFRITVQLLPDRVPEGMDDFVREAGLIRAAYAEADSLLKSKEDSSRQRSTGYPERANTFAQTTSGKCKTQLIDINRADSTSLLPLKGIGPVFAGRIIKYRGLLGGFVSVDQLREVYGIPQETIMEIRSEVYIDSTAIHRICVDSATFRELLRHPYMEYEDVKALVKYRDFKGDISSMNELRENQILADSTLNKIDGYFDY